MSKGDPVLAECIIFNTLIMQSRVKNHVIVMLVFATDESCTVRPGVRFQARKT